MKRLLILMMVAGLFAGWLAAQTPSVPSISLTDLKIQIADLVIENRQLRDWAQILIARIDDLNAENKKLKAQSEKP